MVVDHHNSNEPVTHMRGWSSTGTSISGTAKVVAIPDRGGAAGDVAAGGYDWHQDGGFGSRLLAGRDPFGEQGRGGTSRTYKGGFGFGPMFWFADSTGVALAAILRPGEVVRRAVADRGLVGERDRLSNTARESTTAFAPALPGLRIAARASPGGVSEILTGYGPAERPSHAAHPDGVRSTVSAPCRARVGVRS